MSIPITMTTKDCTAFTAGPARLQQMFEEAQIEDPNTTTTTVTLKSKYGEGSFCRVFNLKQDDGTVMLENVGIFSKKKKTNTKSKVEESIHEQYLEKLSFRTTGDEIVPICFLHSVHYTVKFLLTGGALMKTCWYWLSVYWSASATSI